VATIFGFEGFRRLSNSIVFLTGLTTAIAIGISGLTGSHLAESAERKLNVIQMKQVLGLQEEKSNGIISDEPKWSEKDLHLALGRFENSFADPKGISSTPRSIPRSIHLGLTPEQAKKLGVSLPKKKPADNIDSSATKEKKKLIPLTLAKKKKNDDKDKGKTIFEEAQIFAGRIAALVDGFSPFLGVMVVIVPFLFGGFDSNPTITQYVVSYSLSLIVLFLLGTFLAKLSRASVMKYGMQMVGAALLTSLITLGFSVLLID
jgi:predicted membrane protein (TIGR00267 family)